MIVPYTLRAQLALNLISHPASMLSVSLSFRFTSLVITCGLFTKAQVSDPIQPAWSSPRVGATRPAKTRSAVNGGTRGWCVARQCMGLSSPVGDGTRGEPELRGADGRHRGMGDDSGEALGRHLHGVLTASGVELEATGMKRAHARLDANPIGSRLPCQAAAGAERCADGEEVLAILAPAPSITVERCGRAWFQRGASEPGG